MTAFSLVALGAALAACVLALCREVRLRRALQKLLYLILSRWRANAPNPKSQDPDRERIGPCQPHDRL